ncbi:hypothetical protein UlMin_029034 [Ulmus minor]
MEESGDVHSEENKASQENKKRRLKTPSQIMALEKFYNEHKYPTEEMKVELAEQLGLTEKQISGWFCHRRLKDKRLLKDETGTNGRQDRLSGVIQDRGSGLGQDSCGSTKQLDYRPVDPKEVESRRLYGHDFPAADFNYESKSHYTERVSDMDDTSSESSSSLEDRLFSQSENPLDMETSRYISQDGSIVPPNSKVTRQTGYKPSGYLKVKGEIENAAITAVKRQLGRNYLEDGPPLGVDFDPLPPGSFESPISDPVQAAYYVGNPVSSHSPDVSGGKRKPSPSIRYEVHNSKLSSRDLNMPEAPTAMHGFGHQETKSRKQPRQKSTYLDNTNSFPGQIPFDVYDGPSYHSKKGRKMSSKHGVEGITDSLLNHRGRYGGRIASKQTLSQSHEVDDLSPKLDKRSDHFKLKPSISKRDYYETPDMEDGGISMMMPQVQEDGFYREDKVMKDVRAKTKPVNEMLVAKGVRVDFPQRENGTNSSFSDMPPRKNHIKGSALEMPSSFSEDETAETSSSEELGSDED